MRYDVFLSLALSLPGSPDPVPGPQTNPPPQVPFGAPAAPVAHLPATALLPPPPPPTAVPPPQAAAQPNQLLPPWPAFPAAPKVDPLSPGGRLLAMHPDILGGPVVAAAIAPLRKAAVSGNVLSSMSANPDRTPFDYRQVQLRQDHGNWKLAAGSFVVADFGGDERAARLGMSAMQYYRFTERCSVGAAPERFSYLLTGGQAPRGTMFGVDGQSFLPERLEVRQVEGRWAVCAGDEVVGEARRTAGRRPADVGDDAKAAMRPPVSSRHGGRQGHDVFGAAR